jgi:hypothetical protein
MSQLNKLLRRIFTIILFQNFITSGVILSKMGQVINSLKQNNQDSFFLIRFFFYLLLGIYFLVNVFICHFDMIFNLNIC